MYRSFANLHGQVNLLTLERIVFIVHRLRLKEVDLQSILKRMDAT